MPKKKALDFTNVKDRAFNTKRIPSGDYKLKVTKVDDHESEAGNEGWVYTLSIMSGTGKGSEFPYYCMFTENSLWKVRNLLVAAGVKVPKKRVAVDPELPVGKFIGAAIEDDEDQEGRPRSVVTAVFPVSEMAERAREAEDEDEEDDEEEERPRRSKAKRKPTRSRRRDEEEEEEDEDGEDEDDEEETPRRSKASKSSRSNAKKSRSKARRARADDVDEEEEEVDEDELEELEI